MIKKVDRHSEAAKRKKKNIQGAAYEIVAIMGAVCNGALEHRRSIDAKKFPYTGTSTFKRKSYLKFLKKMYTQNKDLKALTENFAAFLRAAGESSRPRHSTACQ